MQCKHWVEFLEILRLLECLCARQQQLGLILHAFFIWLAAVCQLCHESFHHSFISSGSSAVQLPSWHQWVNGQLALYRFDALPRTLSPVAGRLFFESSLVSHAVWVCGYCGHKTVLKWEEKMRFLFEFRSPRHAQFGHNHKGGSSLSPMSSSSSYMGLKQLIVQPP